MPKFYSKKFEKQIQESLKGKALKEKAYSIARSKAERAHKEMMNQFDSHPVTQEIEGGVDANNLSGTLGGYGNLFSFIGFYGGSRPVRNLRNYLKGTGKVFREPRVYKSMGTVEYRFKIESPKANVVEALTPSPWEGRSWTRGIERGISGLGFYMYTRESNVKSRSGSGIQKQNKLRSLAFRPVKYMTGILENFYKNAK